MHHNLNNMEATFMNKQNKQQKNTQQNKNEQNQEKK